MKRSQAWLWRCVHVLTIVALVVSLGGSPVSSAARSPIAASAPPSAAFVDQVPSPVSLPPGTLTPVAESPLLAVPIAVGRDDAPSAAEGPAQAEPPLPVVDADAAVIGPEGGAFRSLDRRITVEVPPGAVGGATRFRYTATAFAPGQGRSYLSIVVICLTYENKAISGVTGTPFVTQWSYDALNRPATMTYPGSEVVTTGYNAAGLPSSLSTSLSGTPYVGETQYTAWGAVDLRKLGASGSPVLQTDYIYFGWTVANGRGRLNQIKTGTTGTPDSLQNLTYKYDAIGNVTTITDTKAGGTQVQAFTYDHLHRLSTAQATGGTGGTYAQETYQYNFAGNITSKAGVSYTYGDGNHKHAVTAAGGNSYTYDYNGNMITRTLSGTTYVLAYDQEGRLTGVSGGASASFVYDGDGKRVKAVLGGNTYGYVGEWYEVGPSTRKYYSIGGARVAMRDSGLASNPYYLINDHLGSHALTANNAGLLQAEVRYKAWGEDRYASGTMPTAYRFTGQRWDTWSGAVGLYFYHARYYDASLGRFVQLDTIVPDSPQTWLRPLTVNFSRREFAEELARENRNESPKGLAVVSLGHAQPFTPQDLNRYSYVRNNPVRYADPSGYLTFSIGFQASFGVGIGIRGGNITVSLSFIVDDRGNFGLAFSRGGGYQLGASVFGGATIEATTADTIYDTHGKADVYGVSAGEGLLVGVDRLRSDSAKGPVEGTALSLGGGFGTLFEGHTLEMDTAVRGWTAPGLAAIARMEGQPNANPSPLRRGDR